MGDRRTNSETDSERKRKAVRNNLYPETKRDVEYTGCPKSFGSTRGGSY